MINLYGQGQYSKAIPIAKEVLAIFKKAFGPEHLDVALSLNNLAELYSSSGDYAKAEPLYLRALAIHEKALGQEHSNVAINLNNLALLYAAMGKFQTAHELHKRAQTIDEKLIDQEVADHERMVRENRIMGRKNPLSVSVISGVDDWMIAYTPPPRFPIILALVLAIILLVGSIFMGITFAQ